MLPVLWDLWRFRFGAADHAFGFEFNHPGFRIAEHLIVLKIVEDRLPDAAGWQRRFAVGCWAAGPWICL
jgi:hypothetical protein